VGKLKSVVLNYFIKSFNKLGIENGELTEEGIKQIIDRFESRRENFTKSVEVVIDELFEIIKDVRK